jgi:hypothetical protein
VAEDPIVAYVFTASVSVNPLTQSLTIEFKEGVPRQRVIIAISDTAGKLLQSDSFIPKENERAISIRKLKAPGTYRIAVYCDDKRVLNWGTFERS